MRRNEVINLVRKMSNVHSWKCWIRGEPSPRRGQGLRSILHYPPYYLYFGSSRPYVIVTVDSDGFFVPPPSWEPNWDSDQWKFIERNFSRRRDVVGVNLPSYLRVVSTFLTYIHKFFTLLDLLETNEGEFVRVVKEWTRLGGDSKHIVFPVIPRDDGGKPN